MEENLEKLFNDVKTISDKYELEVKESGENYNIFSIMSMEKDEEFTHSRILGNLLNPKGSHDCGFEFLNLFVNQLNETISDEFKELKLNSFENLVSGKIVERYTGEVNFEKVEGGKIDIIIEDKNQILIIENKIYATDQKFQLARYSNYAKAKNKKFIVLYLTLFGNNLRDKNGIDIIFEKDTICNFSTNIPSEKIVNDLIEKNTINYYPANYIMFEIYQRVENLKCLYHPISYESFIKNWIEHCLDKTKCKPKIHIILKHYESLIRKLTNQSSNKLMSNDIEKLIITNPEFLKAAFEIKKNSGQKISDSILAMLENEIAKKLKLEKFEFKYKTPFVNKESKYNLFTLKHYTSFGYEISSNLNCAVTIQFLSEGNLDTLYVGIQKINPNIGVLKPLFNYISKSEIEKEEKSNEYLCNETQGKKAVTKIGNEEIGNWYCVKKFSNDNLLSNKESLNDICNKFAEYYSLLKIYTNNYGTE